MSNVASVEATTDNDYDAPGVALKSLAYPTPPAPSPTEASFEQQTTRKVGLTIDKISPVRAGKADVQVDFMGG